MKIEKTESGQIKIDGEHECFVYPKSMNWINFIGFGDSPPEVNGFTVFIGSDISEQSNVDKFKAELKDLLTRYDAKIEWDACGDLDGVYDDTMNIYLGRDLVTAIDGCVVCADYITDNQ